MHPNRMLYNSNLKCMNAWRRRWRSGSRWKTRFDAQSKNMVALKNLCSRFLKHYLSLDCWSSSSLDATYTVQHCEHTWVQGMRNTEASKNAEQQTEAIALLLRPYSRFFATFGLYFVLLIEIGCRMISIRVPNQGSFQYGRSQCRLFARFDTIYVLPRVCNTVTMKTHFNSIFRNVWINPFHRRAIS